jgi:hypothetical protein
MYTADFSSTAIPYGLLKRALLPMPSTFPVIAEFPASVNTKPEEVIPRIWLLLKSATTHRIAKEEPPPGVMPPPEVPCGSTAIPVGLLKRAFDP